MKNSFYLVIPAQQDDPQALLSYSESALQQWLSDLPSGNPGLSTRLLQDRIAELTCLNMPTLQRLAALEVLRPYYLRIEEYLRARLSSNRFPKSEQEQKIVHWLLLLEKQYTIGYWMVVQDLTRRLVGWQHHKAATLALQRTVKGLSAIVQSHYLLGLRVPDWVWYDLHSLYQLTLKQQWQQTVIHDPADRLFNASSIEQCYKQVLLLSLVGPSGLMQKELLPVTVFIAQISSWLEISKTPVPTMPQQCLLTLDEDLPPRILSEQDSQSHRRNDALCCYLDLSRLAQLPQHTVHFATALAERFNPKLDENRTNSLLPFELFDYLVKRWQGLSHAGSALFEDRLDRLVLFGLDATHEVFGDPQLAAGYEQAVETHSARILCCETALDGQLSVGSLVSIRKASEPVTERCLGIICTLQLNPTGRGLQFEVMALAGRCFAVRYRPPLEDGQEPHKALLYNVNDGEQTRSYIILESVLIKEEDILTLYMGDESFPIILKQRWNIGLGYWQFECRRIQNQADSTPIRKKVYDFT